MSNRDNFIDAMGSLDEGLFAEHVARKYPSRAQRIKKYAAAAGIYVAACIAVLIILPHVIVKQEIPDPTPGDKPIRTETYAVSSDGTVTEYAFESTAESSAESAETETSAPPETEPVPESVPVEEIVTEESLPPVSPEPSVTVYVPQKEPGTSSSAPVTEPVATTPASSATTPVTESVTTTAKKPVVYPSTYVVKRTDTLMTKRFYGCDYTLSIDKFNCAPGDIITVNVTIVNNGQERITLVDYYNKYIDYDERTHANLLDRVAFKVSGLGKFDYSGEGVTKRMALMPGARISYTTKIDTTDADVRYNWCVYSEVVFEVNGMKCRESNTLSVKHEGDQSASSDIGYCANPFTDEGFDNMFKGNGEIVVTFTPQASADWRKYIIPDDPDRECSFADHHDIERIEVHNDTVGPRVTVSIFLKDKHEMDVYYALEELYQISETNGGVIQHAYPVEADYFIGG